MPTVIGNEMSLRSAQSGSMKSVIQSGTYTKDQEKENGGKTERQHISLTIYSLEYVIWYEGVEVTISENYVNDKTAPGDTAVSVFLQPVLSLTIPTEFRLSSGNQVVGGAYTLVGKYPGTVPQKYYTELVTGL